MKPSSNRQIEVLESRIAPARVIFAGIPNAGVGEDTDYNEAPFVNTEDNPLDPISGAVGPGSVGVADTFYLRLSAGDHFQLFRNGGGVSGLPADDFISVQAGNIVLFFIDKPDSNGVRDNEVGESEIVGIAAGNGARFEVKAALSGDIVFNLNEQGTRALEDDTLTMSGASLPGVNVGGFTIGSSVGSTISNGGIPERVGGKVMASGNIANVIISGDVGAVLAGSAGSGETFDFFPKYIGAGGVIVDTPGGNGVFNFSPASGKVGSTIQKVLVDSITDRMEAGVGGEGAKGGLIKNITVRNDFDGFTIKAGDGGTTSPTRKNGGAGGSVSGIFVGGAIDLIANDQVQILGGFGGDSTVGKGGAGGAVSNIFVGYTVLNGRITLSNGILRDNVTIAGGEGGDGKVAGAGGSVSSLDILVSTPEGPGDELLITGGDGGDSILPAGGKAGIGGSIFKSAVRNVESSFGSDIGLRAGDGGSSSGLGIGGAGGTISLMKVLGRQVQVEAGDGSDGKTGGKGGDILSVLIEQRDGVLVDAVTFNAGLGGDGNAGNAGKGGDISLLTVTGDVNVLDINNGIKGRGGDSIGGRGGAGGKVTSVSILDTDANATRGILNLMTIRSGDGGDGDKGGGVGGLMTNFSIVGLNIEPTLITGDGGDATLKGKGGAAGAMKNIEVALSGEVRKIVGGVPADIEASTTVIGGRGGDGVGKGQAGGAGGTIDTLSINTPGFGSIVAGDGGSGTGALAAAGRGGSILGAGVFAGRGTGEFIAGDAGAVGAKPGAGGSISGTATQLAGLFAQNAVTIMAGNGTGGGAGGSISNLGYGSTAATLVPTPNGQILIQAGNGSASADGKTVGKGGSILNVGGAVSNDLGDTIIRAGDGGSALAKGADGGSITNLSLQRGGNLGVDVTIRAGDGGDAPQGSKGGKGGNVKGVTVVDVSKAAILRHIAAGDGGDALKSGGLGGSVSSVSVLGHDIGVRDGEIYGFNTMGGIFAGAGGAGAKEGVNGSVTIVNADAISSIVAGHGATPKLAAKVENIYLNGSNLLKDSKGAFLTALPGTQQQFEFGGLSLTATETTPGTGFSAEVQSIDITSVRALPAGTQFTFTFQGEETVAIANTATASEIEAALNGLATVKATGPGDTGTVTVTGVDPNFDITFGINGDQTGLFSVSINSQVTGPLPLTATPAEVQTALNSLTFIQAVGGVTVALANPNGYQINFVNPNDQVQIIGQEFFNVFSTEIANGVGNTALTVTETGNVGVGENEVHSFLPIAPFKFSIQYTEGGVTETTKQLPHNATAEEVRDALVALTSIDPGEVSVTKRATPTRPDGTFDVKFEDLVDHDLLQVIMFADELAVAEFGGALENLTKETQVIHVDPMGDGEITIAFGTYSFALNLHEPFVNNNAANESTTLAQALNTQLNLQPSIIAQGGVVVTETAVGSYDFVVRFGATGDQPEISVQEDTYPIGYSIGGRFTHQPFAPVRFGINTALGVVATQAIVPNAFGNLTAGQIDLAIEAVTGPGTINVSAAADNTWIVVGAGEFNVGQRVTILGEADAFYRGITTTITQGSAPLDVREVQQFQAPPIGAVLPTPVAFSLSLNGVTSGYVPADADAAAVQGALDQILAGTGIGALVTDNSATDPAPYLFTITFDQSLPQPQIIIQGLNIEQAVDETVKGADSIQTNEVQIVSYDGLGEFAFHTPVELTAEEFLKGGEFTFEKQTLGLAGVQVLPGAEFTLTYLGEETTPLASSATAANIANALNALATIKASNGFPFPNTGAVTVTSLPGGLFEIQFNSVNDKPGIITGLVKGGASTPLLPGSASLQTISDAINALPPIMAVGGVTIEQVNADEINIIFSQPGQMPSIQAFYQVREAQQLDFLQAGNFVVSYGTNPADVSASLPAGASPAVVQDAINAIPAVQGLGGVTVSNGLNSRYEIQFNNAGDFDLFAGVQTINLNNSTTVEGTGVIAEVQKVLKPRRFVFDPVKVLNGNYVGAFSDSSEINGRVFKWIDTNGNGLYEIDEVPIDGLVAAKVYNQSTVNFTAEARITGGEFSFVETIKGTSVDVEVQLLTIKSDKYTLVFEGLQTVPISGKASILAIQKAINALPTIQATGPGGLNGSVTVTQGAAPRSYAITFNTPGDQEPIIAPFFYDYLNLV